MSPTNCMFLIFLVSVDVAKLKAKSSEDIAVCFQREQIFVERGCVLGCLMNIKALCVAVDLVRWFRPRLQTPRCCSTSAGSRRG
jgi:hypothetical protein